jgi:uncharacterized protein YqhQ
MTSRRGAEHQDGPQQPTIDSVSAVPWEEIRADVEKRESIVRGIADSLREGGIDAAMEIAATDVFVEKAEKALTARSEKMKRHSRLALGFVGFVTLLTLTALFLPVGLFVANTETTQETILSALHNFAALGILLGLIYLGTSFASRLPP